MKHVKAGFLAASLVLTLASVPALAQSNPTGAWDLTIDTPQGANTVTLTLKQDGDKLTGDLASQMGSTPVTGTISSNAVALIANIDIQGNSLEMGINGKVDADTLNGSVKFGDFGEFPFTGKRAGGGAAPVAAAAPAAPAATAAPAAAAAGTNGSNGTNGSGDASGKWDITLIIAGAGEFPATATLTQDGANVTGILSSQAGDVPVKGTMSGTSLKLEFTAETPNGAIPITMTGELGADGLTGKASIAGMGEADWKGIRGK
jgi:hypothetical protein